MILIKWSTNPTVMEPGEPPKTVVKITRLLAARSNVRPDPGWTIALTYAAALTVPDRRAPGSARPDIVASMDSDRASLKVCANRFVWALAR
jgi:hypothetical protein